MPDKRNQPRGFDGLVVAAFESRMAQEMARLITQHGGDPLVAPSMREIPIEENSDALAFGEKLLAGAYDIIIFLTGVGARTLVRALETRYPSEKIIEAMNRVVRVCRGPKPVAALKALRIDPGIAVPEPNTWLELLKTLDEKAPVRGRRVAIQEYGISNLEFNRGLQERGAEITRVPVYRWGLPDDLQPLEGVLGAIESGRAGVALFTNANQVDNVMQVAIDGGVVAVSVAVAATVG